MGREKELLRKIKEEINSEAYIINQFLIEILSEYTKELDDLIDEVYKLLKSIKTGAINNYTDDELEILTLQLPVLIYRAGSRLEELGSNSDIAKANRRDKYNDRLLEVTGTIPEKKAQAEKLVQNEQIMEDIYKRAYEQLKAKIDRAESVNNGIKKAISKRIKELEVFRGDKDKEERE